MWRCVLNSGVQYTQWSPQCGGVSSIQGCSIHSGALNVEVCPLIINTMQIPQVKGTPRSSSSIARTTYSRLCTAYQKTISALMC